MILTPVGVECQGPRRETLRFEDNSNEQVTKRHDETLTAGNSLRTPRPTTKKKLSSGPTDSSSGPGTKQSNNGKRWFLPSEFVSFQWRMMFVCDSVETHSCGDDRVKPFASCSVRWHHCSSLSQRYSASSLHRASCS